MQHTVMLTRLLDYIPRVVGAGGPQIFDPLLASNDVREMGGFSPGFNP